MPDLREIDRVISSHRQREGGGFIVRRPLPTAGLEVLDPFLLLDEFGPIDYGPREAVGAPDHPHRGFETVSYMLEGEFEHKDSAGNHGLLGPGSVQWMTAGAGVVHSEMPSRSVREAGGRVHGFQIWVNLPARLKMTKPRYQDIPGDRIPEATSDDGLAKVKVVAGQALGVSAVIDTHTPIIYHHWSFRAGADVTVDAPADHNVALYVFEGTVSGVDEGQLAILGAGNAVRLQAGGDASALLLGGVPIGEPVARYGPFVMNTEDELRQAFADYRDGRMGSIAGS